MQVEPFILNQCKLCHLVAGGKFATDASGSSGSVVPVAMSDLDGSGFLIL